MNEKDTQPFIVKDCTLIAIATGIRAQSLREMRDKLANIHSGSIYYHFWGGLLSPRFEEPEFNNDFASWSYHALHDMVLAERLSVIDPTHFHDIEDLRREVIDVIEERLYEIEFVPFSKSSQQFNFVRSQIVVFDTHKRIEKPEELSSVTQNFSLGSIFYHFIDARRRTDSNIDDFREWLNGFAGEYNELSNLIANIDPYFTTLSELRNNLSKLFKHYFNEEKINDET